MLVCTQCDQHAVTSYATPKLSARIIEHMNVVMNDGALTRREWLRVFIYAALLMLALSLPYWLAWASQGERVFSGFLFGVADGNSYIAKMRLGAQGHWAFSLFYTAEPHEGAGLLFLPYMLPGQIIGLFINDTDPALTGVLIGTFHLMRIVFGGLLVLVMYRFIAVFLREPSKRFLALVLATVGGGLGWLLVVTGANSPPPEFFIPEGFTLQILLGLPHLALARSALLGGLLALIFSFRHERWWHRALLAGGLWIVVGLAVPFYLAVIYAILGAWGLAAWVRNRTFPAQLFYRALLAAAVTLPLFAYNVLVFTANPAFARWSAQNILTSPPPLHYLLAYLPLALLAIIGGRWLWQQAKLPHTLLTGWVLIVPVLVYLPINVQRRLAEAVIVPLAVLAAAGAGVLMQRWGGKKVIALILLAVMPTSMMLVLGGYVTALAATPQTDYPPQQIAAFNWLNDYAQPGEVVFASFSTGNQIPAYTNLRVYVGLGPETINAAEKERITQQFYAGQLSAQQRRTLYESMRIRYVFYGPYEQTLAASEANWHEGLTRIYAEGGVEIYEVP